MLTQYLQFAADRLGQKKTLDQLQAVVTSKQGVVGITTAVALIALANHFRSPKIDRGCPQVEGKGWFGYATEEFRENPGKFLSEWHEKLGPVYGVKIFGHYATVVSGPYVREVFLDDRFSFIAAITKLFDPNLMTDSGHSSEQTAKNAADSIKRFLSPNLKHYTPRVIEHLNLGIEDWCGEVPAEGIEIENAFPFLQHLVARASASVFVGIELAKNEELVDSFQNMVSNISSGLKPKPWLEYFPSLTKLGMYMIGKTNPAVKRHRTQMANALRPEVDRRLKAMASNDTNWDRPDDMLQHILESYPAPEGLDVITYLINWMTQLIFAALHTTSENGKVVLYRLLQHPEVMEELYAEQNEVLAAAGYDESAGPEVFDREMLNKFVKLDSAVREACRLKNEFVGLPHENTTDKTLTLSNGAVILPGEFVYINQFVNHRDPELQAAIDDVHQFKPFRFVGTDHNAAKVSEGFVFFGMGRHACPGRWFAIQEIKTIVSLLLRKYKVEPIDPIVFSNQERDAFPIGPCRIRLTPRKAL
ncbi:cytochrome P450 [Hesseltinella vesiculosa]|uniref:Cytochrome P450 n=1 Tax=Hesseltinella vesiculosa TaxID=101127 RepID=A0A1X2GSL0_9FUNG|nr:cytochrome P450 [Hesseltinella vesiculosa]